MTEELQTRQKHQERRLLFSEVLESGEEIEGLFQQRRHTTDMIGKRPSRRISYSSSRNPVALLREQIAIYNKKKDPEVHLHAEVRVKLSVNSTQQVHLLLVVFALLYSLLEKVARNVVYTKCLHSQLSTPVLSCVPT